MTPGPELEIAESVEDALHSPLDRFRAHRASCEAKVREACSVCTDLLYDALASHLGPGPSRRRG